MTITGNNSIQTYIIIRKFSDYCDVIPTVLANLSDKLFTLFAHIHQNSFKEIDYIWDVFDQDYDDEDSFDFDNHDSSDYDDDDEKNEDDEKDEEDEEDEEYEKDENGSLIDLLG